MAENNFYELLGLSVEHFENNPAKLTPILEKYILDGKSASPSNKKYKIVAIYESSMRAAIQDPALWTQIYNEYKQSVNEKIIDALMMCADATHFVAEEYVVSIAGNFKVTVEYIKDVGKKANYRFYPDLPDRKNNDDENKPPPPPPKYPTLKSLEPKAKTQIDSIQNQIEELGFSTLAELIQSELNININLSTVSNDTIQEAIKHIKEIWDKKSPHT